MSREQYRPHWFWIGVCAVLAGIVMVLVPFATRRLNQVVVQKVQNDQLPAAQRDLAAAHTDYGRWAKLTQLVVIEAGSEPPDEVRAHVEELLTTAAKYRDDSNYGNAIHKGNLALGRLALREGKVEAAEAYLLKAGSTPGSPELNSFGPNMILAKELLEKGRREKVLEYFALCEKFWHRDGGQLERWSQQVKEGKVPDFGVQLLL